VRAGHDATVSQEHSAGAGRGAPGAGEHSAGAGRGAPGAGKHSAGAGRGAPGAGKHCQIRPATAGDADAVASLAAALAQSFTLSPAAFHHTYPALLATGGACLLVALDEQEHVGYLLGFQHLTFYANGPVAWAEEVYVRSQDRGRGIGRALMRSFEQWAATQGCTLIALATRRAAPFYRALGYEESASYFRKVLDHEATQ